MPWPTGDSHMASLVRSTDWSATPLGPIERWPQSLRTAVGIALAADVPIAIYWGPRLVCLYNDAYAACLGTRHPAALGRSLAQVWPDVWDTIEPELLHVLQTGKTVSFKDREFLLEAADGQLRPRWFSGCFSPIHDETGHVGGVFNPTLETTGQVLAERENTRLLAQARGAAEQLRQMFDQAPGFMSVQRGPEHVFEICNQAMYQIVGHRELVGKSAREAFPELAGQRYWELHDLVYATGKPFTGRAMPVRLQPAPGGPIKEIYIDLLYQPLFDADGSVMGIFTQGHDVTEQHRAMAALRQSEERFRLAMQSSSLGSFDLDVCTQRLDWTESACRMFGYDRAAVPSLADAVGRIHPDDRPGGEAAIASALDPQGLGEYHARYRVIWLDGSLHWIEAVGPGKFAGEGAERCAVRLAGVLWNVTERQQFIETLQQADAHKDEFLAMLAHELRNPLAPLTNALALLDRAEPLTERGRSTVALAQRQTRHLKLLVDDLLEASRVSRGKIELRREPMLIAIAVYQAVESVSAAIEARGQQLRVVAPEEPVQIVADPVRVAQILENLLTNASKYTPEGGAIRVEVERRAAAVEIRVADNGIGIERAKMSQLFELFHQIDATLDRAQGGLGIGLALVKRLVELHGGTVGVESAGRAQGATFTVRLPHAAAGSGAD